VFEYGPDKKVKEKYNGVVFEHGGCKLELGEGHIAVRPHVFKQSITSSKISLMINVDSLSSVITKCIKHKIKIAVPPRHYYWGTLELVIKDPDGTVLVFIAPYSQAESKKVKADENWAKSNMQLN
jgi:uncharacterized glyoxalase superfamily protein PhnB